MRDETHTGQINLHTVRNIYLVPLRFPLLVVNLCSVKCSIDAFDGEGQGRSIYS